MIGLGLLAAMLLDTAIGHRLIADRIAALRPANGLRYGIGRIEGSIYHRMTLIDVRVTDRRGVAVVAPRVALTWTPLAWLNNRLEIDTLVIPELRLIRLPQTVPTVRRGAILPGYDIHIARLRIDRLRIGRAVLGTPRTGRVVGRADVRNRRALIDLAMVVAGSDRLRLRLDAAPDRDRFALDLHARGAADGLIARLSGLRRATTIDLGGSGRWRDWRGRAVAVAGGARIADLALTNRAGEYGVDGTINPAAISTGTLARLTAPRVAVRGTATLVDRQLAGNLSLASAALTLRADGAIDLARGRYRTVRIAGDLANPAALSATMAGRAVAVRLVLDGAFADATADYRLTAARLAIGRTVLEQLRVDGAGRLTGGMAALPLSIGVARVTGTGEAGDAILRGVRAAGVLRWQDGRLRAQDVRITSAGLSGTLDVVADLRTGGYMAALRGTLPGYAVRGLGVIDITAALRLTPGVGGKGIGIAGTGAARVTRLDNGFMRGLAGGLPSLSTTLASGGDGLLRFTDLVLRAPAIQLRGAGVRRGDGTVHIVASGQQARYGPVALTLDGRIARPRIELVLARPNPALGLAAVRARLDPADFGYAVTATGASTLGDFTGSGRIELPRGGGQATIAITTLDLAGIRAHGDLRVVSGGLDGVVTLGPGGIAGTLALRPVGGVQRIEGHLVADRAVLRDDVRLRRGTVDVVVLLDPAGASIDGGFQLAGLRQGRMALSRLTGTIRLRGGSGQLVAALAGARGRSFDIKTVTDIRPGRFAVTASGTIDRTAIALTTPAVITREDDGWALAKTRLAFGGGEAELAGRMTAQATAIEASLIRLPLSVLDLAVPDLGLDGVASGSLRFTQGRQGGPSGRIDATVRGLSRAGLVLTSTPIDVGIAGVLQADSAAFRAVMASKGHTIGRAQGRLAPLGAGSLAERIANAPLFAQLRYDGPADTLWRLTGIEFFDLSGPVAIGADIGGRLNDPRIRGALRANGARIESATTGTVLTNVQAEGRFNGSTLAIDRFTADAGKGGRVSGSGSFDVAAVHGFGMDLAVRADNAVLINRDDIAATMTGPLTFTSDGSGGLIAGNVTLVRSRYRLGQAAAAAAVPVLNIREINVPGGEEVDDRPRRPWRLDVMAKAPGGMQVTGLGLTSEWSADLSIRGAPTNPAIAGRAELVRGTYEFAGREFDLARGVIRFGGEVPVNPALDIVANADATGLSATIRVSGQALKPQIAFTSVPALPEDELLARLLFGTSITNLSAPEAVQLASAVAALQNGGNGLNPINAVRRAVGLDRLRILPADRAAGRTTSFAAGKYVTRRIYAEIITDGQGYSATQVEFQVTRWLSLLSTVSTLGRTSANVRVSKDY